MDWKNQFYDIPSTEILRTTVEIPHALNAQIKKYEPKTGVLQTTISILLTKLSHELNQSNLLVADRYGYQVALANATIVLGTSKPDTITLADGTVYVQRSTAGQSPNGLLDTDAIKAVNRDEHRGTDPMARKAKRAPKLSSATKSRRSDGTRTEGQDKQGKS